MKPEFGHAGAQAVLPSMGWSVLPARIAVLPDMSKERPIPKKSSPEVASVQGSVLPTKVGTTGQYVGTTGSRKTADSETE